MKIKINERFVMESDVYNLDIRINKEGNDGYFRIH